MPTVYHSDSAGPQDRLLDTLLFEMRGASQYSNSARQIVKNCCLAALVLVAASYAQDPTHGHSYQNSDPPNCGSFHTSKIQGTVTNQIGEPLKDVEVTIFSEDSRKPLAKATTDASGRFAIGQRWQGRLRLVFSSDGYLTEDLAVTITKWPDGGLFRPKTMSVVLSVFRGDFVATCRQQYSRK
jgi:hypothetical protein